MLATIAGMKFLVIALAAAGACAALPARAQSGNPNPAPPALDAQDAADAAYTGHWRVMASPYTFHYSHDDAHRPVRMVGLERQFPDKLLWGITYFSNSFGQPSAYLYGGQRLENWSEYPQLFAQWTAGLMYGYKGEYRDKVPLNHNGLSPGLVLSFGWQFTPEYSAQVNVLGNSALMFQVSVDLR